MMKRFGMGALMLTFALACLTGLPGATSVSAQDGTPAATECVSPGLPPGTPSASMDEMASPESMDDMEMGSPEAMEMPEATPLPEGTPADDETAAAITAALENYAACYNEGQTSGDPSLYVALETPNYWMSQGYETAYDRMAEEDQGGSVELISVSNPMTYADGRVSGDIAILLDGHWYQEIRSFLVQDGDVWKYDAEAQLPATPDAETTSVNGVTFTETTDESTGEITYAFEFTGSTEIAQTDALVFNFTNAGQEFHEAIVVQLPDGADPLGLLDGSVSDQDITFYGGVFGLAPGQTQDLVLMNMEPGTYTMLCFFPGPDGMPHAAHGMVQQFEIVAGEE